MAARLAEATFQPDGDMPNEFSAVSVDTITEALNFSQPLIGLVEWAEDASLAHALLAAHYLKQLGLGSNSATILPAFSRAVGPVSHGAAVGVFSQSRLQLTTYGQQYLMMFESRGPAYGLLAV